MPQRRTPVTWAEDPAGLRLDGGPDKLGRFVAGRGGLTPNVDGHLAAELDIILGEACREPERAQGPHAVRRDRRAGDIRGISEYRGQAGRALARYGHRQFRARPEVYGRHGDHGVVDVEGDFDLGLPAALGRDAG